MSTHSYSRIWATSHLGNFFEGANAEQYELFVGVTKENR
jgi:hypothetical protein